MKVEDTSPYFPLLRCSWVGCRIENGIAIVELTHAIIVSVSRAEYEVEKCVVVVFDLDCEKLTERILTGNGIIGKW